MRVDSVLPSYAIAPFAAITERWAEAAAALPATRGNTILYKAEYEGLGFLFPR